MIGSERVDGVVPLQEATSTANSAIFAMGMILTGPIYGK